MSEDLDLVFSPNYTLKLGKIQNVWALILNLQNAGTALHDYLLSCILKSGFLEHLTNKTPVRPGQRRTLENSSKSQSHHNRLE